MVFGCIFVNVFLFILDISKPDHMAKQACSAYLLCEGHDLDTVTQHLMYLFLDFILLIVVFWVVMAQAEKTLINDANKGLIHSEDVCALYVLWKKDFTDFPE